MQVDVRTEIEIDRPRHEVATFAADPDNATAWYQNIKSVEWKTDKPLAVGTQVAFVATFLGRRLAYTYEVMELVPGERLVMSTADGPFGMETIYTWQDTRHRSTRMTLRNRGAPSGFSKVAAPIMATAMRRANCNDLVRLKAASRVRPGQVIAVSDASHTRGMFASLTERKLRVGVMCYVDCCRAGACHRRSLSCRPSSVSLIGRRA